MAERDVLSIGELREALISAMDLGGAWGRNLGESKKVLLRVDGRMYPLASVSAAFTGGGFALVLDGGPAPGKEDGHG
jgi:hypothetical protein